MPSAVNVDGLATVPPFNVMVDELAKHLDVIDDWSKFAVIEVAAVPV